MNITRRIFLSLLLTAPKQVPRQAAVLETFTVNDNTVAVLANHGREDEREVFARWLQSKPTSRIRIRNKDGEQVNATCFRVRMCFGRALIIPDKPIQIRERESLTIVN